MKNFIRYKIVVMILGLISGILLTGVVSGAIYSYRNSADCFLCGNSDRNILNAYSDGVGIIRFNNWSVSSFQLLEEECTDSGKSTINSGEVGSSVSISSGYSRRMSDAKIYLNSGSKPQLRLMATFLCEDCAKKILKEHVYDVAVIDFKNRKVTPLEENHTLFFIDNYALHLDWNLKDEDNSINILAFYAPEIERNSDEKLRDLQRMIEEKGDKQ